MDPPSTFTESIGAGSLGKVCADFFLCFGTRIFWPAVQAKLCADFCADFFEGHRILRKSAAKSARKFARNSARQPGRAMQRNPRKNPLPRQPTLKSTSSSNFQRWLPYSLVSPTPRDLRTHLLRLLGPKTILKKGSWAVLFPRVPSLLSTVTP